MPGLKQDGTEVRVVFLVKECLGDRSDCPGQGSQSRLLAALAEVGGVPSLSRWIECAASAQATSFVVCEEESRGRLMLWCQSSGFPLSNLLPSNSWQSSVTSLASHPDHSSKLVIVDATHILEPTFDLRRLLNHAAVLDKPIFCCYQDAYSTQLPILESPGPDVQVLLHPGHASCRVAALSQTTGAASLIDAQLPASREELTGKLRWAQLVPIYIIRHDWWSNLPPADATSLQTLHTAAANGSLYALRIECCLPLVTDLAVDFADGFYNYHARQTRDLHPTSHLAASPHEAACSTSYSQGNQSLERRLLEAFAEMSSLSKGPPDPSAGRELPACFHGEGRWKTKKEHPLWSTSNCSYGSKIPTENEMPCAWHGIRGTFTRSYIHGGKPSSLRTTKTTSRVHDLLDA